MISQKKITYDIIPLWSIAFLRTPDAATLFAEFMSWLRRGCGLANFFVQLATCPATWKKSLDFGFFWGKIQGKIRKHLKKYGKTYSVFEDFEVRKQANILEHTMVFEKVLNAFEILTRG